jgi:hypothetical protein
MGGVRVIGPPPDVLFYEIPDDGDVDPSEPAADGSTD